MEVMARPVDGGEFRRSRSAGWFGAVVGCAVIAALPGLAVPAESVHVPRVVLAVLTNVPAAVLALVLATGYLELIWRTDLRPRLRWDSRGITVINPVRTAWIPWRHVTGIAETERLERHVLIETTDGTVAWAFNHLWLASKLSSRYAARAGRKAELLRAAWHRWADAASDPPPVPVRGPSRPAALYLLLILTATLSELFF